MPDGLPWHPPLPRPRPSTLSALLPSTVASTPVPASCSMNCSGSTTEEVSYGILVKSHCAEGFTNRAIDLITDAKKSVEVSIIAYTTVLNCLYREGRVEDAEKLWDEMVKGGCEPDVATYNVRLRYAQNATPEEVSGILDEMGNASLRPDAVSYNCLITAYCMTGRMEDAKKVYQEELGGGLATTKLRVD